jgi:phosphoesterase RecJ-like protein
MQTPTQDILTALHDAERVLILFRQDGFGDAIGSATGLALFLERLEKTVDIACSDFSLPPFFGFLPHAKTIQPHLDFLLADGTSAEADLSKQSQELHVHLDGKHHITHIPDLIIVLDSPSLTSLGHLADTYHKLLTAVPILNIDHGNDNTQFGTFQYIAEDASTTAEVVHKLLRAIDHNHIDEHVATHLLAGIIAKTRSFRTPNTSPAALAHASDLVDRGADRAHIINELYQDRSVQLLNFWGATLKTLSFDKNSGLLIASIPRELRKQVEATEHDIDELIHELLMATPEAKIVLVLVEFRAHIEAILHVERPLQAKALIKAITGRDVQYHRFIVPEQTLPQAQATLMKTIPECAKAQERTYSI